MARKRYSDEDVLKLLREIDVHLHDGLDVVSACRKSGISNKSYYYWSCCAHCTCLSDSIPYCY